MFPPGPLPVPDIKFCGLTRPQDATAAVAAGARYVGVVFAPGPRTQQLDHARRIFAGLPPEIGRVGVFDAQPPATIASQATALGLTAVQLHGDPSVADVEALRALWQGQVWAVVRVHGAELTASAAALFAAADAVVLDARVDGALGGTGVTLPWAGLAARVAEARRGTRSLFVLAGGLRPDNVAQAVRVLNPDVVDVSSGIESTVGIKDPARMRAFRDAVRSMEVAR